MALKEVLNLQEAKELRTTSRSKLTHEYIEEQTQLFLSQGGVVKQLPPGLAENTIEWQWVINDIGDLSRKAEG